MKNKTILTLGIITLLIGITFIPVGASSSKPITKESKVYGPLIAPLLEGFILLSEDAIYSSKQHIGKLSIYRDLKLTGFAWGIGPNGPDDPSTPFIFQQIPFIFRSWSGIGDITITMKLWIGSEGIAEYAGQTAWFEMRYHGQGFCCTLETLE